MADIGNLAVGAYAEGLVPPRDPAPAEIEQEARENRVPTIGPLEGQALSVIARIANARHGPEDGRVVSSFLTIRDGVAVALKLTD